MIAERLRHSRQRLDVFGEAGAAVADARVEEERTNTAIHAHPLGDHLDIRIDALADTGNLVDEGDAGGQKGVGRVLDHLGAVQVGDEDPGLELAIQSGHRLRGLRVMGAKDQPIGMHEVLDGAALSEELRVRYHVKRDLALQVLAHDAGHDVARSDRHGALVDNRHGLAHRAGDRLGGLLDEDQVGFATAAHRRAHRQEDEVGVGDRLVVVGREAQAARLNPVGHHLLEPRLIDRGPTLLQDRDLGFIDVDAGDVMTELSEAGRRGQPDVAGPHDRDGTHFQ